MSDEITSFLLQPERLRLTLEIASRREGLAANVVNTFWHNVAKLLREYSDDNNFNWQVCGLGNAGDSRSMLGLALEGKLQPTDGSDGFIGYFFGYECLASRPEPLYLGASRGRHASEISPLPSIEAEIATTLSGLGLDKQDEYWIGYQRASSLGLDAISQSDDELILRLNEDNGTEGRPYATRAATLLWNTFEATRVQLEQAFEQLPQPG